MHVGMSSKLIQEHLTDFIEKLTKKSRLDSRFTLELSSGIRMGRSVLANNEEVKPTQTRHVALRGLGGHAVWAK